MMKDGEVRELAYHLWLEDGMSHGRDQDHWFQAQALLHREKERRAGTQVGETDTAPGITHTPSPRGVGTGEKNVLALASFLGQSRFFGALSFDELRALAFSTEEYECSEDAVIFRQADPGDRLYLIRAGRVKIVRHGPDGTELRLATMSPGDVFGELSVVDGKPRSATAVAMERVEGVTLRTDRFADFLRARPEAALCMMRLLTSRLRQTDDALQDATFAESRG